VRLTFAGCAKAGADSSKARIKIKPGRNMVR
jgi:hypothetical protein